MTRADEVSDQMLMALADNELNEKDAESLLKLVQADPDLAARYAEFVETRALLHAAFPPEPVPAHLIAAVLQNPEPQAQIVPFRKRAVAGWSMAIAASFVLAIGGFWAGRGSQPVVLGPVNLGQETAQLVTGEARDLPDGSTARVLASFQTDLGLCRMIGQDTARHLTCLDAQSGEWAMVLTVQSAENNSFLPASDIATVAIDSLLENIGAGAALTPEQERLSLRP